MSYTTSSTTDTLIWPSTDAWGIPLVDPKSVVHEGKLIVLAREADQPTAKFYYNVKLPRVESRNDNLDWSGWYELDLTEVDRADVVAGPAANKDGAEPLLRLAGMDLVTVPSLAHKADPADAPFQALSAGGYVYVFRQSANNTLYVNRFVLVEKVPEPVEGATPEGAETSLFELEPVWETRYQRSEKKDTPAGPRDTPGYRDMVGRPFIEPTLELATIKGVRDGMFAVVLLPTADTGVFRWHFFVLDLDETGDKVIVYSALRNKSGLFDFSPEGTAQMSIIPALQTDGGTEALSCDGGLAAALYFELEPFTTTDASLQTARRAGRVMLSLPVSNEAQGLTSAMAVFIFGIKPDGTIPPLDGSSGAVLIDGSIVNGTFDPTTNDDDYPIPAEAIHAVEDSTVAAVVLGQVQPTAPPTLIDSGDGQVHLYYAGQPSEAGNPFLVAQFDTLSTRTSVANTWQAGENTGIVSFVAQRTGSSMDGMTVEIAPAGEGAADQEDLCKIVIDYGEASGIPRETWKGVPRSLYSTIAVLNGSASNEPNAPAVRAGEVPYYDYTGTFAAARLPVDNLDGYASKLSLLTRRPDVVLSSVNLLQTGDGDGSEFELVQSRVRMDLRRVPVATATSDVTTLTLTFDAAGRNVVQTWSDLPADTASAVPVLDGTDSAYLYEPSSSDTLVYGLVADSGNDIASTVLLFADPDDLSGGVTIVVADSSQGEDFCDLAVSLGSDSPIQLPGVGRAQSAVVDALTGDPDISAAFFCISPDVMDGMVVNQSVVTPLDLRSTATLFDLVPPTAEGLLIDGEYAASLLQGHTVADNDAEVAVPNAALALRVVPTQVPGTGQEALVQDAAGEVSELGTNGRWSVAEALYAIEFSTGNAMIVPLDTVESTVLRPGRGWTLECWVQPSNGNTARILTYNDGEPSTPGGIVPTYLLGTTGQPCLDYGRYQSAAPGSYVQVAADEELRINDRNAFTFEAWVKPLDPPCPSGAVASIIQAQDQQYPLVPPYQLALTESRQLSFTYRDAQSSPSAVSFVTNECLPAGSWSHVAVTGGKTSGGKWYITLYINGVEICNVNDEDVCEDPQQSAVMNDTTQVPFLVIGGYYVQSKPYSVSMFGTMAEVRYWSTRRTQAEIDRTMRTSLSGYEPGLVGYWPLSGAVEDGGTIVNAAKSTGDTLDGTVHESAKQTVGSTPDGKFLSLLAGIGGLDPVMANGFLQANEWNHVAAVLDAGTGLWMNPEDSFDAGRLDWADCGNSSELNLGTAASLEAWVQFPDFSGQENTILSKWGNDPDQRSYWFGVDDDGKLACTVRLSVSKDEDEDYTELSVSSIAAVTDGSPHHVVAVFESTDASSDSSTLKSECTLTLYIDGVFSSSNKKTIDGEPAVQISPSEAHFTLGSSSWTPYQTAAGPDVSIEDQRLLHGVLAGVRVWIDALDAERIQSAYKEGRSTRNKSGLAAAWWFGEQEGRTAADSISANNARLTNTGMWCLFEPLSQLRTYANGYLVGLVTPADSAMVQSYEDDQQFTVGAYYDAESKTYAESLNGELDELRLWDVARTAEQIRDDMFRPLTGAEEGLMAYWRFLQNTGDQAGAGNNGELVGDPQPEYTASAAPVANEGPWLRNVYGGQQTSYQEPIEGTPAVAEYTDSQRRRDGTLFSVMKRGYFWVNQSLTLQLGYKVGDLTQVYIGQVQTQPNLIGFIEGAPPVPSENLSRPYYNSDFAYLNYNGSSAISLKQAETTQLRVASSDYRSTHSFDVAGQVGVAWKSSYNISNPYGFSYLGGAFSGHLGYSEKSSQLEGETDIGQLSSGWTDATTDSLNLRGTWEPHQDNPSNYLNPWVGRRFVPKNVGYALVESRTGDMYSLFMPSTGAMVGTVVVPNLEIPLDRNIIIFQIDPIYVTNGTLDGKVGFVNDPSFPAADIEPGSYFDPKEAYILKSRIERETEDLEAWYAQIDPKSRVRDNTGMIEDDVRRQYFDWEQRSPRKSICNSYVWTADGGLHAEEQQTLSQRTQSYKYSSLSSAAAGVHLDTEATYQVGLYTSIDMLWGSKVDIEATSTRDEAASVELDVVMSGEPSLLCWNQDVDGERGGYSDTPCPGKVDAYRFMTFYLAPSYENAHKFDEVVDQNWLRNSSDPNAVALRSANLTGNEVWRVLHRVTYVSRVPPESNTVPAQTVGPVVEQPIIVEDNLLLIGLVQEALGSNPPTTVNIGDAVAAVLDPDANDDGEYPPSLLGELVPWWEVFLDTTRGEEADSVAQAVLSTIRLDTLAYMEKGYAMGLLPV